MSRGNKNGNWKGGISLTKTVDDFFDLPKSARTFVLNRIWKSVVKNRGCWKWSGLHFKNDRPRISFVKNYLAYRVLYVLLNGKIGTRLVLHTCDRPWCMNPKHLVLGSNKDNSSDMVSKKRQAWGDRNSGAKISNKTALAIIKRIGGRKLYGRRTEIAREFGVSKNIVSLIANRKTWRMIHAGN